jgi:hypothetical protein
MGAKNGTLSLFGGRSTLACAKLGRSSCGGFDLDQVIIAEYPSRDAYLSMSSSKGQKTDELYILLEIGEIYQFVLIFLKEYMETAHFRHLGHSLEELFVC